MEVVEAGDEQQAREVIHQAPPTAVLTDLALPGGDGLGVLSAAKASDGTLPVILVSPASSKIISISMIVSWPPPKMVDSRGNGLKIVGSAHQVPYFQGEGHARNHGPAFFHP